MSKFKRLTVIGRIHIKEKYQDKEKANINSWLNEGELSEENKLKQFQLQKFHSFLLCFTDFIITLSKENHLMHVLIDTKYFFSKRKDIFHASEAK